MARICGAASATCAAMSEVLAASSYSGVAVTVVSASVSLAWIWAAAAPPMPAVETAPVATVTRAIRPLVVCEVVILRCLPRVDR